MSVTVIFSLGANFLDECATFHNECATFLGKSCAFALKSCKFTHTGVIGGMHTCGEGIPPSISLWANLQLFRVNAQLFRIFPLQK